jgi:hypothetical protein
VGVCAMDKKARRAAHRPLAPTYALQGFRHAPLLLPPAPPQRSAPRPHSERACTHTMRAAGGAAASLLLALRAAAPRSAPRLLCADALTAPRCAHRRAPKPCRRSSRASPASRPASSRRARGAAGSACAAPLVTAVAASRRCSPAARRRRRRADRHLRRRRHPEPAHRALARGGARRALRCCARPQAERRSRAWRTRSRVRAAAPRQECLISFFSDGFPLEKAEAYVALVKCARAGRTRTRSERVPATLGAASDALHARAGPRSW